MGINSGFKGLNPLWPMATSLACQCFSYLQSIVVAYNHTIIQNDFTFFREITHRSSIHFYPTHDSLWKSHFTFNVLNLSPLYLSLPPSPLQCWSMQHFIGAPSNSNLFSLQFRHSVTSHIGSLTCITLYSHHNLMPQ